MKTNAIVGGLMAVLGALSGASLLAEEPAGSAKARANAQAEERRAQPPGVAQSVRSQRRERVRYTFPPTKR
jgi:hypothetical protein